MARVPDIKRIQKSDFEEEYQELVDKLAFPINSFFEQTRSAFDRNIDFRNLNQEVINIDITVDAFGIPTLEAKYRSTLKTKVLGHSCINAINISGTAGFPTGQPFLTFVQNNNIVTILNVTGLPADTKYTLVVLSIGTSN